jgi:acetyl esterase/lipase
MDEDRSILTRPAPPPDRIVHYGVHADQLAEVRFGPASSVEHPLVLFVHGGFWRPQIDRAHAAATTAALAAAGWTVASVEYRRVPGQPELTLEDIQSALRRVPSLLQRFHDPVLLVGHSAGGHLVLCAAAHGNPALAGVLALAPVADLRLALERNLGDGAAARFLGAPTCPDNLDPRRLGAPSVATTLVHGVEDEIVPLALAESYRAAYPRVRLVSIEAAGHFALIDPLTSAWPTVLEELDALSSGAISPPPRP